MSSVASEQHQRQVCHVCSRGSSPEQASRQVQRPMTVGSGNARFHINACTLDPGNGVPVHHCTCRVGRTVPAVGACDQYSRLQVVVQVRQLAGECQREHLCSPTQAVRGRQGDGGLRVPGVQHCINNGRVLLCDNPGGELPCRKFCLAEYRFVVCDGLEPTVVCGL